MRTPHGACTARLCDSEPAPQPLCIVPFPSLCRGAQRASRKLPLVALLAGVLLLAVLCASGANRLRAASDQPAGEG